MYQVKCDEYILYDPRDEDLIVLNPNCKLEVNTVGEGSFTILSNHPYYTKLKKLKSIFEIIQDGDVIFRGRMTSDSRDFYNRLNVDLEGVLAFTNDTIIPPFNFPEDFTITSGENVVKVFLRWLLQKHNEQAQTFQQLKLGNVTVTDPNNYIVRSSEKYLSTWEVLKTRLFESSLGGYLVVRYESDGNYVDYLNQFELTNTQKIIFGENLLDIQLDSDASETYSAIMPLGGDIGDTEAEKYKLTLASLPDGDLTDDLVKWGNFIYSRSALNQYGWICVPIDDATWDDVTEVNNLKTKAMEYLTGTAMKLSSTIEITAVDLKFTDAQIQSFRMCRNILVDAPKHGVTNQSYPLTKLDIDLFNPQNTKITIGDTIRTMTGLNDQNQSSTIERVEKVSKLTDNVEKNVVETVRQQMVVQETSVVSTCSDMILSALQSYVETGDYNQFVESVQTQLKIVSDQIEMEFTTTTDSINNVNGDLQRRFEQLSKYIRFDVDGITIGSDENSLKLSLDNDMIKFMKNGLTIGWWDGTDFHTGNMVVEVNERAQFGDFAFLPRSDGSLMFLKVGNSVDNLFDLSDCTFEENVISHADIGTTGSVVTVSSMTESAVEFLLDPDQTYKIRYTSDNCGLTILSEDWNQVYTNDQDGTFYATVTDAKYCYFGMVAENSSMTYTFRDIIIVGA